MVGGGVRGIDAGALNPLAGRLALRRWRCVSADAADAAECPADACGGGAPLPCTQAAVKLPMVGYGTNADHGAGCNIHPPPKQYCGKRLANSAMALQYGKAIPWRSPTFKSQVAAVSAPARTELPLSCLFVH